MTIKGKTDKPNPARGMIRIGQLFKGDRRPEDGRSPGKELPYFRVEFNDDTPERKALADNVLRPAWNRLYGAQAKTIPGVYLIDNNVDLAFATWMLSYAKSGLVRRCDGAQQLAYRKADGTMGFSPIPCAVSTTGCDCKQSGLLRFVLQGMTNETGLQGYFTLNTHGNIDIGHIHGALTSIELAYGTLINIPLILERVPHEVQVPAKGQDGQMHQVKMTKYMCQLVAEPQFVRSEKSKRIMAIARTRLAIPAHIDNEGEIIEGEAVSAYDSPEQPIDEEEAERPAAPITDEIPWYKNPERLAYYHLFLQNRGWATGWLPGKMEDYISVKAACMAIETVVAQMKVHAPGDDEPPEEEDTSAPAESWFTEEVYGKLLLLCDEINLEEAEVMALLNIESWTQFANYESAVGNLTRIVGGKGLPLVVEACTYHVVTMAKRGQGSRIVFKTMLGSITWYGGRKALTEFYSSDVEGRAAIAEWTEGPQQLPEPLLMHWIQEPNGAFRAESFEELLSGGTEKVAYSDPADIPF